MLRPRYTWAVCTLALAVAACGGSNQAEPPDASDTPQATAPAAAEAPQPLPGESSITGRILFEGTAPAPRPIRMTADPQCMPKDNVTSEALLVGSDKGLQNVFVYVKDGLGTRTFVAPKTPVVLDQVGCQYVPHVFGVQVGQPIEIVNSDATVHNVHAVPKTNDEFNFAQLTKNKRDIRVFDEPEIGVPIRCDVHGWMTSYAGIVTHPFYAVSNPDGSFEIKGLPEGTYTIEAWHERLGVQTQSVTVDGKASASLSFSFKEAS